MTPYIDDPDFRLYVGDALDVLRRLPDDSIDCCVTSPPYWGLRDYGGLDDQIGLEETPDEYVARLVEVLREVRRVMVPTGTLWLNLGDSFTSGGRRWRAPDSKGGASGEARAMEFGTRPDTPETLKEKELVGIPWRVAFALQSDGWYLRMDNVWAKPNPMPESATDRPTKAHEYVFLLSASPRYYYDQEAVREPFEAKSLGNWSRATYDARNETEAGRNGTYRRDYVHPELDAPPQAETLPGLPAEAPRGPDGRRKTAHDHSTAASHSNHAQVGDGRDRWPNPSGRNLRSVWWIATHSYAEAHFATFPEELPRKCIAAGVPERVCRVCGKPSERLTKRTALPARSKPLVPSVTEAGDGRNGRDSETFGNASAVETVGWTDCGHDDWRLGVVLDPFSGAGTTSLVARKLGRASVGIELNAEYAEIQARRNQQQSLFAGDA